MRASLLCFFLAASLIGCQPVEMVRQVDERPSILVENAPSGAILVVDGLAAGMLRGPTGSIQAIRVESGTHRIQVTVGASVLLDQRLFVSGAGIKTLSIPGI
jgi:hypothetical protein